MRKIFVLIGKASTGKDSLINAMSDLLDKPIATSFTTRPKRIGEIEGKEYNFISDEEFWDLHENNLLAEYTSYEIANGETWHYGLTKEELEKSDYVLVIVNPDGLEQLKRIYGDKICSILIESPADIRIRRYLNRDIMDDSKVEECCRRFLADQIDFKELKTDYIVHNEDNFKSAVDRLESILRREIANDLIDMLNEDFQNDPRGVLCR